MPRRVRLILPVLGALTLIALIAGTARADAARSTCRIAEVRLHDEAVFGHFSTQSAARHYAGRATALGFQGVKVENEGCGDFEVEIDGADERVRTSFAAEA
ncbi:MAG: hypothetical protein ACYDBR_15050, partial [Gaiellaceae bacterium]